MIPDAPGLYGIVLTDAQKVLEIAGYPASAAPPLSMAGGLLMNIGSAHRLTLRTRILHHLAGTTRQSSFRRSLGTILKNEMALRPVGRPGHHGYRFDREGEARLTGRLRRTCKIIFAEMEDPRGAEMWLIKQVKPALNIRGLEQEPFAKKLLHMRWRTSLEAVPDSA